MFNPLLKKRLLTIFKKPIKTRTIIESGPHIPIRVSIQNNHVTLKLDTSGHGLNKRGYRTRFDAPLRETLAAAMIKLSRWDPENDALIDPCCGSGTILIEAGMIANNIAPGLNQTFCSEEWPVFKANEWQNAREEAVSKRRRIPFRIYGSDVNPDILKTARYNIEKAGLSKIFVETKDVADLRSRFDKGKIICNPPMVFDWRIKVILISFMPTWDANLNNSLVIGITIYCLVTKTLKNISIKKPPKNENYLMVKSAVICTNISINWNSI